MDLKEFVAQGTGVQRLAILSVTSGRTVATWNASSTGGATWHSVCDAAAELVRALNKAGEWNDASTIVQRGVSGTWATTSLGAQFFAVVECGAGTPLGVVHAATVAIRAKMHARYGDNFGEALEVLRDDTPTGPVDRSRDSPEVRAARVVRAIRRRSPDPETMALRVAVRSRVSLDRLLSGADLLEDEIERIENVAEELLT